MKKKLLAILAIAAAVVAVPTALFAWGPSRATFTTAVPATYVTFNSITDNPVQGDERNFVQIRDANASNATYADSIGLTAGHEYVVFVYFHNNAASNYNDSGVGVAQGAYVKATVPTLVSNGNTSTKIVGYVGASNANPTQVWDDVSLNNATGSDIALSYVAGSAVISSKGAVNGSVLNDTIVTTGAPIGYDSLNGVLKGCNQYAGYVTFRVKAEQPNFTVSKQVHKTGVSGNWSETVAVNPGDSVDYLVTYKNTSKIDQANVTIKDVLPANATYVAGTTYLANTVSPNGAKVDDTITTTGLNIGSYAAGANAYVKFTVKISANNDLANCGTNTLVNSANITISGVSVSDTANVTVDKTCTVTPPELPHTGASEGIVAILGLGAAITSLGYYLASRRVLNR